MTDQTTAPTTENGETRKRAPAANFLPIVRGRLPLLLVHAIRFHDVISTMSNKDLAVKFGTSIGKVFDIKKGRNFAYVKSDYKPTADDVAAAKAWGAQFGATNAKGQSATGDKALIDKITAEYEARGLGTAEDAAKLSAERAVNRKPREPKAGGTTTSTPSASSVPAGAELLS